MMRANPAMAEVDLEIINIYMDAVMKRGKWGWGGESGDCTAMVGLFFRCVGEEV